MGSWVHLRQVGPLVETEFTVVRPDEADLPASRLPVTLPLVAAALGHRIGDEIEEPGLRVPVRWRIVEIRQQPSAGG